MNYSRFVQVASGVMSRCASIDFDSLKRHYDEPHRFYHTIHHIHAMFSEAEAEGIDFSSAANDPLAAAILFHDIVYEVGGTSAGLSNEKRSAELFKRHSISSAAVEQEVIRLIHETEYARCKQPAGELSATLRRLDFASLRERPGTNPLESENQIFREYQQFDWVEYQKGRIQFLTGIRNDPFVSPSVVDFLIRYNRFRTPSIGLYAGTFHPFHTGHYNVLKKAEMVFDKVIVARGRNPAKPSQEGAEFPTAIQNRQRVSFDGLLSDFIKKSGLSRHVGQRNSKRHRSSRRNRLPARSKRSEAGCPNRFDRLRRRVRAHQFNHHPRPESLRCRRPIYRSLKPSQ